MLNWAFSNYPPWRFPLWLPPEREHFNFAIIAPAFSFLLHFELKVIKMINSSLETIVRSVTEHVTWVCDSELCKKKNTDKRDVTKANCCKDTVV